MSNRVVSMKALIKLPGAGRVRGMEVVADMDGEDRRAVTWEWLDESSVYADRPRRAYFDAETGEYIGEA